MTIYCTFGSIAVCYNCHNKWFVTKSDHHCIALSEELLRQVSVDAAAAKLASYVEDNAGAEYPLDIGEDFSQEQGGDSTEKKNQPEFWLEKSNGFRFGLRLCALRELSS